MATLRLARRRSRLAMADQLSILRLAAHGDEKAISATIKTLSRGW